MSMNPLKSDVVIIGGGAAGMMAAVNAAMRGLDVIVLETQKSFGRKLRITGKGRCNVTNDCDVKAFMQNVPVNSKFLYSCLNKFSPADTIAFFESLGVPMKTERGGRVFPVSDRAHDVADALVTYMKDCGVRTMSARATGIKTENGAVVSVSTSRGEISCSSEIGRAHV